MSIFSVALKAHNEWARNFRRQITRGEQIDPMHWGANSQCKIGRWLSAIEPEVGTRRRYRTTVEVHNNIHHCAGNIAKYAREGRLDKAEKLIPFFEKLRHYLVDALHEMEALHSSLSKNQTLEEPKTIDTSVEFRRKNNTVDFVPPVERRSRHLLRFVLSFSHETDKKFVDRRFLRGINYYLFQLFGEDLFEALNRECGEFFTAMDQEQINVCSLTSGSACRLKLNIMFRIISQFTNFEHSTHRFLTVVENGCEHARKLPTHVTFIAFFDPVVTTFDETNQDKEESKVIRFMFSQADIDLFESVKTQYHRWLEKEERLEVA